MTLKDLIDKYNKLAKTDEMINLNQVISDLKQISVSTVRKFIIKGDK